MISTILLQAAANASFSKISAALCAAIVAFAAAWGISRLAKYVMEASARQPEIASGLRTTAIIVGALIEGVCLFAVIVCLLSLY